MSCRERDNSIDLRFLAYQSWTRRHIVSRTGLSRKPLMAPSDSSCDLVRLAGMAQWVASVRYMIHDIGSVTVARDLIRYVP